MIFFQRCIGAIVAGFWVIGFAASAIAAAEKRVGVTTVTLSGQTKHPSLQNATVEISAAGNAPVIGSTDEFGSYSVLFDCADPDGLITIRVIGSGDQAHVGAARVVHGCAHVTANADAQQIFQVGPITPLSTAVYAVLAWTMSDEETASPPWSEPQIAPYRYALESFYGVAMQGLAFLNDGGYPLPAGADNSLDAVLDRALLVEVLAQVSGTATPEDYDAVLDPFTRNPSLYLPTPTTETTTEIAQYCVSLGRSCGAAFTIDSAQTGSFAQRFTGGDAVFTLRDREDLIFQGRMESGPGSLRAVRVERSNGEPLTFAVGFPVIDGEQVEQRVETDWYEVREVDASEYLTMVGFSDRVAFRYPNNPEIPEQVFESRRPAYYSGYYDDSALPEWSMPADGEQWILEFKNPSPPPEFLSSGPFFADRVTFSADGSATLERIGATMQWSVSQGILTMQGGGLDTHEFRRVSGDWSRQYGAMVVRSFSAGVATGAKDVAGFPAPDSTPFVEANVPGRYAGVGFNTVYPGFSTSDSGLFTLALEPGGVGWSATLIDPTDSQPPGASPLTWSVNARGEIEINRELGFGNQWRSWTLLKLMNGEDFHVLEVGPVSVFDDPDYSLPFAPGRLNIYRRYPLP
jgi:hypothetical protein